MKYSAKSCAGSCGHSHRTFDAAEKCGRRTFGSGAFQVSWPLRGQE